jgi:hypothetical protein
MTPANEGRNFGLRILAAKYREKLRGEFPSELPAWGASPVAAMHVFCAEDPARGDVLPAMDHTALFHGQASVVVCAHSTYLAMNAHLLPLKACALPWSEAVISDSISNASLLVELALYNRILRLFGRSGLGKCDGRRCKQGRHKYELHESHGVSPSVTAVT